MRKIDQLNKLQSEMMEARTKVEDLCYDWGWTLSDKTTNDNEIIEELKMQLDIAKEELAYYHDVEKDYNNDIKLFQEENAKLIDENIELEGQIAFKDGQIIGLNNQIKELQAKIEELTNAKLDSIVKKHVEGDDAMEQPKAQPKKKNSPLQEKLMKVIKEEKHQEENIVKVTKEKVEETKVNKSITMTYDRYDTKEAIEKGIPKYADIIIGVNGTNITINDKSYKFKARREFYMPVIYGCFDEEVARIAREEIKKIHRFNLASERTTNDTNFKYAQDKEYPIVVWRLTNEKGEVTFHAYTKTKANQVLALYWNKYKEETIGKTLVNNLFTNKSQVKRLYINELADKFRAVCADIWPEDFTKEQHQDTNEIVVDCTNDATAGCDDVEL